MFRTLYEHQAVIRFFINLNSYDEYQSWINFFLKMEKEHGTFIWGIVENMDNSMEIKKLKTFDDYSKAFENYKEVKSVPLVDAKIGNFVHKEIVISELNSKFKLMNEGEEMHHCVGGYYNQVKNSTSFIFSIRGKDSQGKFIRATAEFNSISIKSKNEEEMFYFKLNQLRGKLNDRLDSSVKDEIMEAFKEKNSNFITKRELDKMKVQGFNSKDMQLDDILGHNDLILDDEEIPF